MDFQDDSLRYLMKITSQDNTYNYFEKEVNHVDIYDSGTIDSKVVVIIFSYRIFEGSNPFFGCKRTSCCHRKTAKNTLLEYGRLLYKST